MVGAKTRESSRSSALSICIWSKTEQANANSLGSLVGFHWICKIHTIGEDIYLDMVSAGVLVKWKYQAFTLDHICTIPLIAKLKACVMRLIYKTVIIDNL